MRLSKWIGLLIVGGIIISSLQNFSQAGIFGFGNDLIDESMPNFAVKNLDGNKIHFKEYSEGSNTIVFLWATWCPHCRVELKEFSDHKDDYVQKGIKLMAIDLGENSKVVEKYMKNEKIEVPMFLDEESSLIEPLGLVGVPTFYFVDGQGVVVDVTHSMPDNLQDVFNVL